MHPPPIPPHTLRHYSQVFPASGNKDVAVLDICSSWVSHYPEGYKAGRVAGLGMNADELSRNPQLTEYAVRDLNAEPVLPYEDNSFDVITNCVSVDYLTRPLEVRGLQGTLRIGTEGRPSQLTPGTAQFKACCANQACTPCMLTGLQGDAPLSQARRESNHELQQSLLPHQGHHHLDADR